MIALLTDFGLTDPYVGIMKATILSCNEQIKIIDLCHHVNAQNIVHGQVLLSDNFKFFPENTIFCCVIDPGVGTDRRNLVVEKDDYFFVGPDNGLFTFAILDTESKVYILPKTTPASNTFHGRDIYAPFCAELECDHRLIKKLQRVDNASCQMNELRKPKIENNELRGTIIYHDHFGNLITDITRDVLGDMNCEVHFQWSTLKIFKTFAHLPDNGPGAIIGSTNRLEICFKNSSAKAYYSSAPNSIKIIFNQE